MLKHQGPLFEEAGGGSGGGTPPASGSLLTGAPGSHEQNTPPNGGTTQNLPPDPAKWRDFLSDEFKVSPVLKDYKDLNGLVKSHISLQKMVGVDKLPAPKDDWTPEQWNEFYTRLGRPEAPDKYQFKLADGFPADDALVKEMSKIMHEAGMTNRQVASVMEKYSALTVAQINSMKQEEEKESAKLVADTTAALQKEYGVKFNEELNYARYAVKELGDAETIKALNETHLTNNAAVVKLMAKAGRLLASDRATGDNHLGSSQDNMTPAEAQAALNALHADEGKMKALMSATDPRHDSVVAERTRLFRLASAKQAL